MSGIGVQPVVPLALTCWRRFSRGCQQIAAAGLVKTFHEFTFVSGELYYFLFLVV